MAPGSGSRLAVTRTAGGPSTTAPTAAWAPGATWPPAATGSRTAGSGSGNDDRTLARRRPLRCSCRAARRGWRALRAVLQVGQDQDQPGPGPVVLGFGEPGGDLGYMAAQFGQRLVGQPQRGPGHVDLPAASCL